MHCLSVCLSKRITQKRLLRLTWLFYTRSVIHGARSSSKVIRIGSWPGLWNLLKDSSPLGDRTKYAIKVRHDVKRALWRKHVLGRHMHVSHSERRSVISGCLGSDVRWICHQSSVSAHVSEPLFSGVIFHVTESDDRDDEGQPINGQKTSPSGNSKQQRGEFNKKVSQ